ncbi:putative SOS response-associated peptidase YedK [Caulobacter ginsengisoli]|uniref:Abasic site processing protein n=1 Tax=Caulobacter ginsengisoli TaxID=400775 RepID=A0ABU0IPQ4_9CAUL|nr:SOS response-associated peptidase [Caulobacter ginsengisoli]MDQ0462947.1 putative SOS response-associated peptidase YedK [Caulobacter ginsengisoli]
MCNLYAIMKSRAEIARLVRAMSDLNNNQPPAPGVYPDTVAPIITKTESGERVMRDVRWGMPSSKKAILDAATRRADKLRAKGKEVDFDHLLRMEPDRGTTNVRNTNSGHWTRWLGPQNRALVPFTSFSEPDQVGGSLKPVWFGLSDDRPLAFFAGIWTPWTCVRKIKEGEVSCDLFGFLTTDANAEVAVYHNKAMPVILREETDLDLWMSDAPWSEVKHLQRPLPNGSLKVVATGVGKDEAIPA